jgi:hypothetical protein
VEKMTTYIFRREDNNFTDILNDKNINKYFKEKISFRQHLILSGVKIPPEVQSYLMLKFSDDMITWDHIRKDNSPIPYVDYTPDSKRPEKFKNAYK